MGTRFASQTKLLGIKLYKNLHNKAVEFDAVNAAAFTRVSPQTLYGKLMKTIILLITLFSSSICVAQDLSGRWILEEKSSSNSFTINITEKNNEYLGWYCAVAYSGRKIDCSRKSELSFRFPKTNEESYVFPFRTYFSRAKGVAELHLESEKLYWKITEQPNGEHYAPKNAVLVRNKDFKNN